MKNEENDLYILEIERFSIMLDDFDEIFKGKDIELQKVLNQNTLNSVKRKNLNLLLFAVRSYQGSIKRIASKYEDLKTNIDFNLLSNHEQKLIGELENKLNRSLETSRRIIDKYNDFLIPDEKTNDLV